MGPRKLQPDEQDVPHIDGLDAEDSDEDFDPIAEMIAQEAEDDEATLREEEQALLESAAGHSYEQELEMLRNDQEIPVEKLKEMFGFGATPPIGTNTEHESVDVSSIHKTTTQDGDPAAGDQL